MQGWRHSFSRRWYLPRWFRRKKAPRSGIELDDHPYGCVLGRTPGSTDLLKEGKRPGIPVSSRSPYLNTSYISLYGHINKSYVNIFVSQTWVVFTYVYVFIVSNLKAGIRVSRRFGIRVWRVLGFQKAPRNHHHTK